MNDLYHAKPDSVFHGFRLVKKEAVASQKAELYTLRHEKTGTMLLYFDRADENKTFCIGFRTLPEDHTGVFHILEHSVLNGSEKYPVKEPFVSMLQSSLQTFLNAMTYNDKTVYPVASRNERDFFNLMEVYLDAVFRPLIYSRPEIFMQEGWHYEFEEDETYFNGVVYSEMKGVYADVDSVIDDEVSRLLFPDTCYGFVSGGHPDHITELTYEQFLNVHRRFYHPSNAMIFLDGHMDIDAALRLIDGDYLSKYEYRAADFDFAMQQPKTAEKTVTYAAQEGEEELSHMAIAKILGTHDEVEKIYAAKILADYLTGSNEAPLKREFLEKGIAQDASLYISGEGAYQPTLSLVVRNANKDDFSEIRALVPAAVRALLEKGIDKAALAASLERFAFVSREITSSYGVDLAVRALDGWLYGDDPLTHIENAAIFDALRERLQGDYFEKLLEEMLADADDKCYLYVLPSMTKDAEDAQREAERLAAATADWTEQTRAREMERFEKMQEWQQSADSEEVLAMLPHLDLKDIPREIPETETVRTQIGKTEILHAKLNTNGIVYLNLFFDVSDFDAEELRRLNVLAECFGELRTQQFAAETLQTKVKGTLGALSAKVELMAKPGEIEYCKPYLMVSAAMLAEKAAAGMKLLTELLTHGKYDETDRIAEILMQSDYFLKQSLIGSGHSYAITKSLAPFSKAGAMKETLEGESFVRWFSAFTERFRKEGCDLECLAKKAFAKNRLFVGYAGTLAEDTLRDMIAALGENEIGAAGDVPQYDEKTCTVEIPGGVGYSAFGGNLYALGHRYTGSCAVLSALVTYTYLWNMVRVQGGAYGTGMSIRSHGDIYCYSYRDPNPEDTSKVYRDLPQFAEEALGMPIDDIIIGTVNTTDPHLTPMGLCLQACVRALQGTTHEHILKIRREILETTPADLKALIPMLQDYCARGKLCVIGEKNAISFAK